MKITIEYSDDKNTIITHGMDKTVININMPKEEIKSAIIESIKYILDENV